MRRASTNSGEENGERAKALLSIQHIDALVCFCLRSQLFVPATNAGAHSVPALVQSGTNAQSFYECIQRAGAVFVVSWDIFCQIFLHSERTVPTNHSRAKKGEKQERRRERKKKGKEKTKKRTIRKQRKDADFAYNHFLLHRRFPINCFEPFVPFHVLGAVLEVADAPRPIGREKPLDQISATGRA